MRLHTAVCWPCNEALFCSAIGSRIVALPHLFFESIHVSIQLDGPNLRADTAPGVRGVRFEQ
jgi:hypothetical protein